MDKINNDLFDKTAYIAAMKKWEEEYFREHPDSLIFLFENELHKVGFAFEILQQIKAFLPEYKSIILPLVIKYYEEAKQQGKDTEQNQFLDILGVDGLEEVVPMLLEDYCSVNTQQVTQRCITNCLKKICSKRYAKEYVEIVANSELGIRRQNMVLLVGKFKIREAIPVLIQLLEEDAVCQQAICALGEYRSEELRPYFERFVTDEHLRKREYAREALWKLEEGKQINQPGEMSVQEILAMLDWNCSQEAQKRGLVLAREYKNIESFLGPASPCGSKGVWANCALVLLERSDEELKPYLQELLEWLQDMNWPGAYCILERLGNYKDNESFHTALTKCIELAGSEKDDIWLDMLLKLQSCETERLTENKGTKADVCLKKTVKSVVDGWDPIDLLSSYAPRDEYASEIVEICELTDTVKDSLELGKGIHQIFAKAFGEDVFRESIDDCIMMARFIYTAKLWPALRSAGISSE